MTSSPPPFRPLLHRSSPSESPGTPIYGILSALVSYSFFRGAFSFVPSVITWEIFNQAFDFQLSRSSGSILQYFRHCFLPFFVRLHVFRIPERLEQYSAFTFNFKGISLFAYPVPLFWQSGWSFFIRFSNFTSSSQSRSYSDWFVMKHFFGFADHNSITWHFNSHLNFRIPLEAFGASTFECIGAGLPKSQHTFREIRVISEALSSCNLIFRLFICTVTYFPPFT